MMFISCLKSLLNKLLLGAMLTGAILCSASAFATVTSGWTKIRYVYPTGTGLLFVTEYKNLQLSTCDGGSRFLLNMNHPDYATQVSALLAAFVAQKDVNLFITEQAPTCHALVDRFMVNR